MLMPVKNKNNSNNNKKISLRTRTVRWEFRKSRALDTEKITFAIRILNHPHSNPPRTLTLTNFLGVSFRCRRNFVHTHICIHIV